MKEVIYKLDDIIELLFINYINKVCKNDNHQEKNKFTEEIISLIFGTINE